MNIKMVFYTLGWILKIIGLLLIIPLIVSLVRSEGNYMAFIYTLIMFLGLGIIMSIKAPQNKKMAARESLIVVGLSWIIISLIGCFPYLLSGEVVGFVDCFFENVSGFTSTGSSVINDVEALSKSLLLWRSLSQWLGGIGVLAFVIMIAPNSNANALNLLKSESAGPEVGKLSSKIRKTALIIFMIYFCLTVAQVLFLLCSGLPFYDSLSIALTTAATGGFSIYNGSVGAVSSTYVNIVTMVFMLLFSINFNLFYLILIGEFLQVVRNEELRWFFIIIVVAIAIVAVNILNLYSNFAEALMYSSFHVISSITTTGFTLGNITSWPLLSQCVLMLTMFTGGCAGSTAGGFKIIRCLTLTKTAIVKNKNFVTPRNVSVVKFNGRPVDDTMVDRITHYFVVYMICIVVSILLLSLNNLSLLTSTSQVFSCFNNVGLNLTSDTISGFTWFSKIVLSLDMLLGRLEIFPIIMLFSLRTWRVTQFN